METIWRETDWARVLFTILRVYVGWNWLTSGYEKVFGSGSAVWVGGKAGTAVTGFLQGALAKTAGEHPDVQPWYAWFIQHVALPNAKVFSYTVAWGELLVGLGLIVGMFTTIAIIAGMLMNLNYLLAGTVSTNPVFLFEEIILLCSGSAATYWSLERLLKGARKRNKF